MPLFQKLVGFIDVLTPEIFCILDLYKVVFNMNVNWFV